LSSAEIDTRTGHVIWWLVLDLVWLFLFWQGITVIHGAWNPLTFSGSTLFCHLAFHADSTLALARAVFLYTVYTRGRGEGGKAAAAAATANLRALSMEELAVQLQEEHGMSAGAVAVMTRWDRVEHLRDAQVRAALNPASAVKAVARASSAAKRR
jgi:hypothetical protein